VRVGHPVPSPLANSTAPRSARSARG
jgi:hypothetical protein